MNENTSTAPRMIQYKSESNIYFIASAEARKNLEKAKELFNKGAYTESSIYFSRVIASKTKTKTRNEALTGRAQIYLVIGQPLLSIADLNKTSYDVGQEKSKARKNIILGVAYIQARQYQMAINTFNQASRVLENEPSLYSNRAVAYQNIGKIELAKRDLYKALKLAPTPATILNLAVTERKSGNYQTCLSILDKIKGDSENYSRIFLERGSCQKNLGMNDSALKNFLKAIQLEGAKSFTLQQIGEILIAQGEKENGLKYLEKSSEILLMEGEIEKYEKLIQLIEKER
ncbi:hypothetical protein N9C84_01240 [Desulfobacterales bacterium]|nr:hypothetical protein [Desulfobacterales bacterium]